jgi:hypothetical protein
MSNPHDNHDELDLDAETVRDLEPRAEDEDSVQGGAADNLTKGVLCIATAGCVTNACRTGG